MAAEGELDGTLIDLLDQNIVAARSSGQVEAAEFMQKIRNAANRYVIRTADADTIKQQFNEEQKLMEEMIEKRAAELDQEEAEETKKLLLGGGASSAAKKASKGDEPPKQLIL